MMINIRNAFAALALASATLVAAPAQADPSGKDVQGWLAREGSGRELATILLHSYFQAYLWASEYTNLRGDGRIYCPPMKLAINSEQAVDIFKDYLKAHPTHTSYPAGLISLKALQYTFPCE